jgi:uncharacterized membrane protein
VIVKEPETYEAVAAPTTKAAKKNRLAFIDWTRGLAAFIMLQGHVFHSFANAEVRQGSPYIISQFIGGIAPAVFLFLTGVTLAFLLDGLERKGAEGRDRFRAALNRAGYLFTLAVLFRLQLWLFAYPQSPWTDLLKVDILNCMFVAILTLTPLAFLRTTERIRASITIGFFISVLAPLISMAGPNLPTLARMYLVPDPNYFPYFPWAAFVAFGVAAGSILRIVTFDLMHRTMVWAAIVGFGLVISAQYFSNLPYSLYPSVDFWLNSPGLTFIKVGVILLLLAFTFLWTHSPNRGWSPVQQLGQTSLLVYWVHIELVYGRWFGYFKDRLTYGQCVAAALILWAAMLLLSWASTRYQWKGLRTIFGRLTSKAETATGRA